MHARKHAFGLPLPSVSFAACAVIAICFVGPGLSGCAPPYPVNLPHLNQVDESYGTCPQIEGMYLDKGDIVSQEGKSIGRTSLTRLLHGGDDPLYETVQTVVISRPAMDAVEVHSLHNETSLFHWQQSGHYQKGKDEFSCVNGYFVLGLSHFASGLPPAGMGWFGNRGLWCRKAVDGSLVVLDWSVNAGWIVLVPYWVKDTSWYRFPPAGDEMDRSRLSGSSPGD